MWFFILGALYLAGIAGGITFGLLLYRFVPEKNGESSKKKKLICIIIGLIPFVIFEFIDYINTGIVGVHVLALALIYKVILALVKKWSKKEIWRGCLSILTILTAVIYLSIAFYLDYHVWRKDYQLTTTKSVGSEGFRLVMFADSHVGAVFDGEGFAERMKEINKEKADCVVIVGDYVDDDTTKEDMIISCKALGDLETKYGVYYVFGNHDKGYFKYRNFTGQELRQNLTDNGVTILEDDNVIIDQRINLLGRQDKSTRDRRSMEDLVKTIDQNLYTIVLDHQPQDYEAQEKTGVDLVLSGHTHGGQMLPFNRIGEWTGINNLTYGLILMECG